MVSWSNEEVFKFIDLYQGESIIWNPKHDQHKNKNKVNDAWNRIADSMNIPVNELKRKKESLMAAYRKNRSKKTQSVQSGMGEDENYNPIWPFFEPLDSFLSNVYESSSVLNTEDNTTSSTQVHSQEVPEETSSRASNSVTVPVIRRRARNPTELEEAGKQMSNAYGTLNEVLNKSYKDDDCELYGKLLATKLRKMSDTEREEVMFDIDKMLINRRRNKQSTQITHSYQHNNTYPSEWSYSPPSPSPLPLTRSPSVLRYQPPPPPRRVQILSEVVTPPHLSLQHSRLKTVPKPSDTYQQHTQSSNSLYRSPSQSQPDSSFVIHMPSAADHDYIEPTEIQDSIYQAYKNA